MRCGLDAFGSGWGPLVGLLRTQDWTSVFRKSWEFVELLRNCCLLKNNSGPWSLVSFFQWLFQPIQGPGLLFSSVIICTQRVGLLLQVISPSQSFYLNTGQQNRRINTYTGIHALSGNRTNDPSSERAKAVHALDRAATLIGMELNN
jgi:hypothetical protein